MNFTVHKGNIGRKGIPCFKGTPGLYVEFSAPKGNKAGSVTVIFDDINLYGLTFHKRNLRMTVEQDARCTVCGGYVHGKIIHGKKNKKKTTRKGGLM